MLPTLLINEEFMGKVYVTKSITAENTFSDPAKIVGQASFVLSGTWAATVNLQRSRNAGSTYDDVTDETGNVLTWTKNVTLVINEPTNNDNVIYRFGVKTGAFTSGTVVGEITQ